MISYFEASSLAFEYFKEKLNVLGLAEAMESENCYIFTGGKHGCISIGGVSIRIDKNNADISVLNFPSKENTQLIKNANIKEIYSEFICD